jgi:hypothetical protein
MEADDYRRNLRTTGTKTSTTSKAIRSGVILLRHRKNQSFQKSRNHRDTEPSGVVKF